MNTTTVIFSGRIHTAEALSALWQWDYGQKLIIQGLSLPHVYEVHFCNAGDTETILQLGDSNGVTIPDQCLEAGRNINAYIFLHDGNNDGETVYKITIKVNPRPKPTDRTPDERQKSSLDAVISAINAYISSGGGNLVGGIEDYNILLNRPKINGVIVSGEKTGLDLGLVNAVQGKGLSTNDYDNGAKNIIDRISDIEDAANNNKVFVVHDGQMCVISDDDLGFVKTEDGKGLSKNDYIDEDKQFVAMLKALASTDNNGKDIRIVNGQFATVEEEAVHEFNQNIVLSTNWNGADPYTQTVTLSDYNVTPNTKVDLVSDIWIISQMENDGVDAIYIVNDNSVLTAYAIGGCPSREISFTATVSEIM